MCEGSARCLGAALRQYVVGHLIDGPYGLYGVGLGGSQFGMQITLPAMR
jgi:hypothetical protein